jgi:hypothetical protein
MKKLLFILLLTPVSIFGQILIPTHYDAEHTAQHILKGHAKIYLQDSVKFTVEKKAERYITTYDAGPEYVNARLKKVFKKGRPEYASRTSGGYLFTIVVINPKDETKIINYVTFHVDVFTQKIQEVEILLGE